jgi:hypothetical protein
MALAEEALEDGDWAAVDRAVTERLSELHMSLSYLARETGLSQTTIRYLGTPNKKHNKSTLVAISAILGWRHDHLINVLRGQPEKNILGPGSSPVEAYFQNLLSAEVGPMREQVAELTKTVNGMAKRIDVIFQQRQANAADQVSKGERALLPGALSRSGFPTRAQSPLLFTRTTATGSPLRGVPVPGSLTSTSASALPKP